MAAALEQARRAASLDEVPIGAVVMRGDEIVAEAHNETVARITRPSPVAIPRIMPSFWPSSGRSMRWKLTG